jgi:hypothetical protein
LSFYSPQIFIYSLINISFKNKNNNLHQPSDYQFIIARIIYASILSTFVISSKLQISTLGFVTHQLIRPFEILNRGKLAKISICMAMTATGLMEITLSDVRCIDTTELSGEIVKKKTDRLKSARYNKSPLYCYI